ncbi:methyltransferase domain-containing protein [Candidatus Pelagibacter sp.]|uniref:methyltransferase domain-containing protein n=1 Tax=Candidatus Pelagibacter sp. TaxID=2024849 RepID=UPI003F8513D5
MPQLKNWDNKTWLSSKEYIDSFVKFLIKNKKLNKDSNILDIGCGRGKILGKIKTKAKLRNKPIGIDPVNHKDKDKNIIFKKIDTFKFLSINKRKFDLIIIKQTIHFFPLKDISRLIKYCKNTLNDNGKLMIFSINEKQTQIPTFSKMEKRLIQSLKKDLVIKKKILRNYKNTKIKIFNFKVKINRSSYLDMIKQKYISVLLDFKKEELEKGMNEINFNYPKTLRFIDSLNCLIINKVK